MGRYNPGQHKGMYIDPARKRALELDQARRNADGDRLLPNWLVKSGRGSWYAIGIALVVIGIVFATSKITPVFIAVFIALVFTALLNPSVNWMSRRIPRWAGVLIAIVGSFAFVAGLLAFVISSVAWQWQDLGGQLTNGIEKILSFLESTPLHLSITTDEVYEWFTHLIRQWETYITDNWQSVAGTVLSNAGVAGTVVTITALSIFVAVFFLHSGAQMWRWFINLLPSRMRANTNHAAEAGWSSFAGYARGTVIISVSDGALAWILLAILGVPLAPALAVLVMLGAFIPLVGAPAAMVVAMLVALATDGVIKAIIVGLGIALIGQFEGHILQPLIMSRQVSLHPVVVGIGVVAGALVGGLLGAMIIIPIMGVAWAVFSALYHRDPPVRGALPGAIPTQSPPPPATPLARLFHPFRWAKERRELRDQTRSSNESPVNEVSQE
ncbi:AI-2E family transporter [Actinomycetaceae bacterium WB03_NA08]|uniref:AI-2E family transporter n=1 Tax=Scrofimicrobium canadense TaxID=2652290 RepID=A0A6N7W705_9ACTO|nr:AI-2E family transporter [Scrofimicrobium canadense]MSS84016.1 AI-2E family transporter [Scrofimicrobium canadense]